MFLSILSFLFTEQEEYMKTNKFLLHEDRDTAKLSSACTAFRQEHGVQEVHIIGDVLTVTFDELVLSSHYFEQILDEAGLLKHQAKKKRGFLSRFIDKLAKSNTERYGSKRLDCCDVNKKHGATDA